MASPGILWMGNLEPYMDEGFIKQAFRIMGEEACSVRIVRDKKTGNPAGYCFVELLNPNNIQRAVLKLNKKTIPFTVPRKRFRLEIASYGKEHLLIPEYTLLIANLSDDVDSRALYEFFAERYQTVRMAKVMIDDKGNHRGYGFVRFSNEMEHRQALIELQHMTGLGLRPIQVSMVTPVRKKVVASTPVVSAEAELEKHAKAKQEARDKFENVQAEKFRAQMEEEGREEAQSSGPNDAANPKATSSKDTKKSEPEKYEYGYDARFYLELNGYYYDPYYWSRLGMDRDSDDESDKLSDCSSDSDEFPLDHGHARDMDTENWLFMNKDEEFYRAMEAAKWPPIELDTMMAKKKLVSQQPPPAKKSKKSEN